jgi:hypothetical protein
MNKPRSIQISIPAPCSQNWDEMAPAGQGRFCAHCSETVIDFTNYSDSALYNFFAKNNSEHVCGRFLGTQLDRNIHIPPQPHSQLYRLTVAFGLTLLFTQTPQLLAQNRTPIAVQSLPTKLTDTSNHANPGILKGNIMDDKKEPLPSAVVQVFQNGVLKGGTVTDYDGDYNLSTLQPGTYEIRVIYYSYDTVNTTAVELIANQELTMNFTMSRNRKVTNDDKIIVGRRFMLDMNNPTKRTYTREEINNFPH